MTNPTVITVAPTLVSVTDQQTFTPQPCDLGIDQYGEIMLTPDNDLAFVTGKARLAQDVWMLAMQPYGSNYGDPAIGSQLAALVGRRMPPQGMLDGYASMLTGEISALQQKRIIQGDPPGAGEAIASITATASRSGPNAITAALDVQTQDGQTTTVLVPITGTLPA